MEQYWMPKKLDAKNLRLCVLHYQAERLFIRQVFSVGGEVKVSEELNERKLSFKKDKSGLTMLIDGVGVHNFPLKSYDKGFSLAYERVIPTDDGIGRMVMLSTGVDPYDQNLPEPRKSILRIALDNHLMEITFEGRVHLQFHSWWIKPHWKYWTIIPKPKPPE